MVEARTMTSIIIGGGPGGLGPLIWAAQNGLLPDWLDRGVTVVERQGHLGGTLERFGIHSDSLGGSYLESLEAPSLPDALGMGTKYVVVPYSSLMVRDKKMMLPGATKDSLKALPEFKYAD
jgi:phytoene dehydrogenase-like protein